MSAFASDSEIIGGGDFPAYYPLEDIITNYAPEYAHSYFYINYEVTTDDNGRTEHQPWTMFIPIRDNATYTDNNGIITIPREYLNPAYYHNFQYYLYSDGTMYSQDSPDFMFDGYSFSTDLVFNEALTEISFNGMTLRSEIVLAECDFAGFQKQNSGIEVHFYPSLSGQVDRSFTNQGKTGYYENFDFDITNHRSSAIQYKMYIVEKNQTTHRPIEYAPTVRYDDDPVFVYYTNEWVYCEENNNIENANSSIANPNRFREPSTEGKKRNKGSDWHYLGAGQSKHQPIYYNQVNLKQGVEYTVIVEAIACPYDCASTRFDSIVDGAEHNMSSSDVERVYQSDFSMLQYDDVKYDPENNANGILPYDGYKGNGDGLQYDFSYNAEDNGNGSYNYTGFKYTIDSNKDGSSIKGAENADDVIANSSGAFSFITTVFGVFPPEVSKILIVSLWLGVILFIIRRLA